MVMINPLDGVYNLTYDKKKGVWCVCVCVAFITLYLIPFRNSFIERSYAFPFI
jgi:hypothetical protein